MWSPWRMAYLERTAAAPVRREECFFCDIGAGHESVAGLEPRAGETLSNTESGVVWRGMACYALLNAFPYANGHVMLAPYYHEANLDALPEADAHELMRGMRLVMRALRRVYRPEGFNIGANLGVAAGAGFGDHVHVHVVPRWHGDTNFMTTVGETRVIPEELARTAQRLRHAIAELSTEELTAP